MLLVLLSACISVAATSSTFLQRHHKQYISVASTIFILLQIVFHLIAWLKRKRFYRTTSDGGSISGPNYRYNQGSDIAKGGPRLLEQHQQWAGKHGPTFLLWKGLKPCVVVTGGIQLEKVLGKDARKYNEGLDLSFMKYFLGKGLICEEFYGYGNQVRIDTSGLHNGRENDTLKTTKLFTDEAVDDFLRKLQHQSYFEINMYTVVSQIMLRTLFAENFARPLSRGETNYLFINLEDAKVKGHRQKEALVKLRNFLTDTLASKPVIQKAIDESRTLGVWLGSRMTDAEIVDQMMLLLLICQELPSSLLSTISQYVALHRDIDDGIIFEIREIISKRMGHYNNLQGIMLEELPSLHLVEATVKEGLRFAPPLPVIGRKCTTADNLGGINIPKGTSVLLSLYANQHDSNKWLNPQIFLPERHLMEETVRFGKIPMYCPGFQPFGSGPLKCPVGDLSVQQAKLILATFIQTFTFTQTEKGIPQIHIKGVSARPINTLLLLRKRGNPF